MCVFIKMTYLLVLMSIWVLLVCMISFCNGDVKTKHVVFIVADDLGWDDVSFHGSDQVLTPNIDLLAYTGVALTRHYSHCVCTPSRAALLTGKFGYTTGMHGYPLTNAEERGLPVNVKILPQYLKELGYATHLVGKWHLGRSRTEYLPTYRGFDTYFGHIGGAIDYYEYTYEETWENQAVVTGFDLFNGTTPAWDTQGYITDIYTNQAKSIIEDHDVATPLFLMLSHIAPHSANDGALLQAPPEEVRAMRHIENPQRRIYSAMVKKLDDSVGEIVETIFRKGILDDTTIVFISDNGGMTSGISVNYASNWPLRGTKLSPFEGGVRTAGLVWNSHLSQGNHLRNQYMHLVDWLPTIMTAVGGESPPNIDGVSQWENILTNNGTGRTEIFEFDDYNGVNMMISNDFKLVNGTVREQLGSYQGGGLRGFTKAPPSYEKAIESSTVYSVLNKTGIIIRMEDIRSRDTIRVNCQINETNICYPSKGKVCLYNINDDPCEQIDLSDTYPNIVETMLDRLRSEWRNVLPRPAINRDPRALPKFHDYTWPISWADNLPKFSFT